MIQTTEDSIARVGDLFPITVDAWRSIFNLLVYQPTKKYWDPFWQPIIRTLAGTLLISPHMVIASSPQRNLMTLLNRSAEGRRFYNRVSVQKEEEQLRVLAGLFDVSRYTIRKRVPVTRNDGTRLTDVDLILYDKEDRVLLLIHAKWLIRPDSVQEVLARDQEVAAAFAVGARVAAQISDLGLGWISNMLGADLGQLPRLCSVVVNQDFVPSGWVYNEQIPVVKMDFLTGFVTSSQFNGLASLYTACTGFNEYLEKQHSVKLAHEEIQYGEYVFEIPTVGTP